MSRALELFKRTRIPVLFSLLLLLLMRILRAIIEYAAANDAFTAQGRDEGRGQTPCLVSIQMLCSDTCMLLHQIILNEISAEQ